MEMLHLTKSNILNSSARSGANAEAKASNMVTSRFVSLRGALVYALFAHARLLAYVASPQR
eukprot:4944036-Pyramimonas_sp.AAC.1